MKTEPWQWIVLCVLTAAIYTFAQDFVVWLNWVEAPLLWVKVFIFSLMLSVVAAGVVYRFFAWIGSIPGEDPRQMK
ncbi:hypothetical protein [Pseudomonas syringae]|uniref:hypothetical protein n=1 Tax=Pseudomonas syringae TaxID=317 RepID=UPI0032D90BC1